jgi:hexosaminidase
MTCWDRLVNCSTIILIVKIAPLLLSGLLLLLVFPPSSLAADHNALLPLPQQVKYGNGYLNLEGIKIALPAQGAPEDQFASETLAAGLRKAIGYDIPVSSKEPGPQIALIRTGPVDALPAGDEKPGPESRESYQIHVTASGAEIKARSSAGLYYGIQTFLQLLERQGSEVSAPEVTISDWPTLAYRGVMMDLSHGPLPTEEEIRKQIDFLARWKGNQYYFYSELSIELHGYPLVNPNGRYSQDQVRRIIAYARERHVDVVPCLEFYGHLHDLFRLERYANLAPLSHGTEINPVNPITQKILADWAQQMVALFPSPWIHIGLDEPWELERAGSAAAGGQDPEKLFLDNLKRLSAQLMGQGKRVLFWADINSGANLFNRYPSLMTDLPKGVVAVPWHYEAEKDYTSMVEPFQKANVAEVVASGIWAWDTLAPDFNRTFLNIDGFLRDGKTHGTLGIVNTNWSDAAQILYRTTLPGIAYGAVASWQSQAVDSSSFFDQYCERMYDAKTAPEVSSALRSLSNAETSIGAALGSEDGLRLWEDPYAGPTLVRSRAHLDDLRAARLSAEEAQEHLYKALDLTGDTYSLPSLMVSARLIDYAGMKFLYAVEIADAFKKLDASSTPADVEFWLDRQAASRDHSRIADLMDGITGLREDYRAAWLTEYTPFRLGTAIGRFDAEYEYWRKLQAKIWDVRRNYKPGSPVPTLESVIH